MSVRVSALVWKLDAPAGEKIVLLKMADCANDLGESIYPSCAAVALDCCCSERHVQRVWSKYRELGVLVCEGTSGGRGKTTRYSFDMAMLKGEAQSSFSNGERVTDSHRKDCIKGDTETVNTCRPFEKRVTSTTLKGDTQSQKGDNGDKSPTPPLKEGTVINRQEPSGKGGVGGKPKGSTQDVPIPEQLDTPEFLAAWRRWFAFRREDGHALTKSTAEMQLKKLAKETPSVAVAMIDQSIEHGWQGLFPLKGPAPARSLAQSAQENLNRLEARLSH